MINSQMELKFSVLGFAEEKYCEIEFEILEVRKYGSTNKLLLITTDDRWRREASFARGDRGREIPEDAPIVITLTIIF